MINGDVILNKNIQVITIHVVYVVEVHPLQIFDIEDPIVQISDTNSDLDLVSNLSKIVKRLEKTTKIIVKEKQINFQDRQEGR